MLAIVCIMKFRSQKHKLSAFNMWHVLVCLLFLSACKAQNPSDDSLEKYLNAREEYISGNFSSAEELLLEIAENQSLKPQVSFLLAKTLFMQGQPAESQAILEELLKNFPEHADARVWLARSQFANENVESALETLEKALLWCGEDPRVLSLMGSCHEVLGNTDKALDYYRKAALFEEEMVKIYLSLANLYGRNRLMDVKKTYLMKADAIVSDGSPFKGAVERAGGGNK